MSLHALASVSFYLSVKLAQGQMQVGLQLSTFPEKSQASYGEIPVGRFELPLIADLSPQQWFRVLYCAYLDALSAACCYCDATAADGVSCVSMRPHATRGRINVYF
jgi:hypothetical protein